jgi:hypothetical protein
MMVVDVRHRAPAIWATRGLILAVNVLFVVLVYRAWRRHAREEAP